MRLLLVLVTLLFACKKSDAETSAAPEPATAAPAPVPAAAPAATPTMVPSATAPSQFGPPVAGGLVWSDGEGLVRRQPKSSMRAAEYGVEGEPQAELSVFYFGEGQGGAVEPNIERWLGQFTQPDGSPTIKRAKRSTVTINGLSIAKVEATGTYAGGMAMPGAAAANGMADAMLVAAIASGPKGPVFFKLTGPQAAVTKVRPGFDAMIASLRAE